LPELHEEVEVSALKFNSLEDFSAISNVGIVVVNNQGDVLFKTKAYERCMEALTLVSGLLGVKEQCVVSLIYGGNQSRRFGGQYIFNCPCGFVYFASPLLRGYRHDLSVIGGPVLMCDYDDFVEFDIMQRVQGADRALIMSSLAEVPVKDMQMVTALSEQLHVNALHLSEHDSCFTPQFQSAEQLDLIFNSLSFHTQGSNEDQVRQGEKLIQSLAAHDEYQARSLLNCLLGHLLFHTGKNMERLRSRMLEFTIVLEQAARKCGYADMDYIFGRDNACLLEIDNLETMDAIVEWLNGLIDRFTECVFRIPSHQAEIVHKTIKYLKNNLGNKVTRADVSKHVNMCESQLGKVIKTATGFRSWTICTCCALTKAKSSCATRRFPCMTSAVSSATPNTAILPKHSKNGLI
jgi:ligand-binding sensor protein